MSINLDESIVPERIITGIRYQNNAVCIFKESMTIIPVKIPAPTECSDIFHQRLINVTVSERRVMEKIKDFTKTGIWNLNKINEVIEYNSDAERSGKILSFLFSIVHPLIML